MINLTRIFAVCCFILAASAMLGAMLRFTWEPLIPSGLFAMLGMVLWNESKPKHHEPR